MSQTISHVDEANKKAKSVSLRILIYIATGLILTVCLVAYLYFAATRISLDEVRNQTGIIFPNTASITHQNIWFNVDPGWDIRVAVPAQAGQPLVQQLNAMPTASFEVSPPPGAGLKWWAPRRVIAENLYENAQKDFYTWMTVSEEGSDYVFYIEHAFSY